MSSTPPATSKLFSEDTLKAYPSLSKFADADALGKSYAEMEKFKGNSLRMPAEDAKPEEWNDFYSKLGRPESPDKYGLKAPEILSKNEGLAETVKNFSGVAHQLGLTPKQAQGLMDWFGGDAVRAQETVEQASAITAKANEEALRKEWGGEFDKNITLAQRAFVELSEGDKDIVEFMQQTGAHNDPRVLKFFAKLGKALEEDQALSPENKASEADGKDAQDKINSIRNDKNHPYNNKFAAGHKEALEEMKRLYDIAYPNS